MRKLPEKLTSRTSRSVASRDRSSASLALRLKLATNELGNDTNVQCRAVDEIILVGRLKRILVTAIETSAEDDGWTSARSSINSRSLLCPTGSVALIFLSIAIGNGFSRELARVDCICTGVVLNLAAISLLLYYIRIEDDLQSTNVEGQHLH